MIQNKTQTAVLRRTFACSKPILKLCTILAVLALTGTALANSITGRFATITMDGSASDWRPGDIMYPVSQIQAGAPINSTYTNVMVCNDSNYLYVALQTAAPTAITSNWTYNLYLDTDNSHSSGFTAGWMTGGYDCLVQYGAGGSSYSIFNFAGGAAQSGWSWSWNRLIGYSYSSSLIEWAIPKAALNLNGSQIRMEFNVTGTGITTETWANQYESGAGTYTWAEPPPPLTNNLTLVDLTQALWSVDDSGAEPAGWLAPGYDDTQYPWSFRQGMMGFTPTPEAYPSGLQGFSPDPNSYYFTTHFQFTNAIDTVVLVATNYLSDGAVYYLNGVEVKRERMPAGPVSYSSSATSAASPVGSQEVFAIDPAMLARNNVLQVETHQAPGSAADMVLGLSLTAAIDYPVTIVDPSQPANRFVHGGDSTTFSAQILGSGPFSYQWLKDGVAIAGATNPSYTIALVLSADAGAYALRVSNPYSTNTTRAAVLGVDLIPVTIPQHPANQLVLEGKPAGFSVQAAGSMPLAYQWFKDASPIAGGTNASYSIVRALLADAGSYYVQVSNPCSLSNSLVATLTVSQDSFPFMVAAVSGGPNKVQVTFTRPLDATTAANAANYSLSDGVAVLSATLGSDPSQVTLVTGPQTRGRIYTLTASGVQDLHGHLAAAKAQKAFLSSIAIDGSFEDWAGLTAIYTNAQGSATATDFKEVTVYNDANYIYFRVTLWEPSNLFDSHNNLFFDTDNNPATGYFTGVGSEMLIQNTTAYQEKNGVFNAGLINGLELLTGSENGTNFEFRLSRAATYATDGMPVFTTNVVNLALDGENSSWQSINRLPTGAGTISCALVETPAVPLGPLAIGVLNGQATINWTGAGRLQVCDSLSNAAWTDVVGAANSCAALVSGTQKYYRLVK